MKVGIYFRELISVGGGNYHTLAIAEHLSRHHQVDLITHTPLGAARTLHRFGLKLDNAHLRLVPAQPDQELGWLTAEYDLFINRFHSMFIPNQARLGVLFVLFPVPVRLDGAGKVRRTVARGLNRLLIRHRFAQGFFGEEHRDGLRQWLLAPSARMDLAPSAMPYTVDFRLVNPTDRPRRVQVAVDGAAIHTVDVPPAALSDPVRTPISAGGARRLTLASDGPRPEERLPVPQVDGSGPGPGSGFGHLALTDFQLSRPSFRLYTRLFERWLPDWRHRLLNVPPDEALARVQGYPLVWSNSAFTQTWVRRYWDLDSDVIHPPIPVERIVPRPKEPWILSVGRFFTSAHNKKHLVMVEAFAEMCRQGLTGWTLHLAGEVIDNPIHRRYFEEIQAAAQGYPIRLHPNLSIPELDRLYGESAIYWHAAGFGEDEDRDPIRHEHFGITTVEAMAGGCVPVVIGKGGQREIITHGKDGFLWQTVAELQGLTAQLIQDADLRAGMSTAAHARSRHFDQAHFEAQIDTSLARMGR